MAQIIYTWVPWLTYSLDKGFELFEFLKIGQGCEWFFDFCEYPIQKKKIEFEIQFGFQQLIESRIEISFRIENLIGVKIKII